MNKRCQSSCLPRQRVNYEAKYERGENMHLNVFTLVKMTVLLSGAKVIWAHAHQ